LDFELLRGCGGFVSAKVGNSSPEGMGVALDGGGVACGDCLAEVTQAARKVFQEHGCDLGEELRVATNSSQCFFSIEWHLNALYCDWRGFQDIVFRLTTRGTGLPAAHIVGNLIWHKKVCFSK
jgi:hypothetical protein